MINKKFGLFCIFVLTISLLTVKAHWIDDAGPEIIEGDWNNVTTRNGYIEDGGRAYEWKEWDLNKQIKDAQQNTILSTQVYHKKRLYYKPKKKAQGTAYCLAWCVKKINGQYTKGAYDIHAQARGQFWYRGDREENDSFFGGGSWDATKDAERRRYRKGPTYSGVHLKGKAHVSIKQGDELKLQMNWF